VEHGGNVDEALALAQSAKAQFPDDPYISDTLGWTYYKKNIFSRAIVYLRESNEKIPNHPVIHYHLGMAYYKKGDGENAKRELKKAIDLDSKFQGVEEARAALKTLK
jgi:tetratricopeptide (TPR) repeat protein